MGISSITDASGYNADAYLQLMDTARTQNVSQKAVTNQLLAAINTGVSFDDAIRSVTTALPTLPPPIGEGAPISTIVGALPSLGAGYLALITDTAAEERRASAQQRAQQTEIIVDTIKEQASEMRKKATMQLIMGIASGLLSIAQGLGSMKMMKSGIDAMDGLDVEAQKSAQMLLNQKVSSANDAGGGLNKILGGISEAYGGYKDANIKHMETFIEQARAQTDALRSLEDSMKELISKVLSTMNSIQENLNQTRTKILG